MATLAVYVRPKGSENAVLGFESSASGKAELSVRLKASPVDGKANEALIKLLAKEFGVAKSCISIKTGQTSRHKILQLDIEDALLARKLAAYKQE